MNRIEVKILEGNLNGMPKFLARLTQRGHIIKGMDDVLELRDEAIKDAPSKYLLSLPHTTIQRMNYITVAITGLSTKAVSQLRTHAKRLTFVSTSTQYSDFSGCNDNYVIPDGLDEHTAEQFKQSYQYIQWVYEDLIKRAGVDKDKVSYILPQGLRKTLIISGSLDDWNYVLRTRLCHRNTEEVQYIANLIVASIRDTFGEEYIVNMLPSCVEGKCQEGKFSCGEKFDENSLY